jgi:hypothetical protein
MTYRRRRDVTRLVAYAAFALFAVLVAGTRIGAHAQGSADPRYQTRTSDCRHQPPPGTALQIRSSDSGILRRGYRAERVLTQNADASRLEGGDIVVCTEYGRVEIVDSDDDHVRLQIRIEGMGEGSAQPAEAATRVIDETRLHTFMTGYQGRLMVRVWHSTLGFTSPGGQPAGVSVRLQVPPRGQYRVRTEAFHGVVAIRRLALAGATLRGNIGEKFKGIPGYLGATELDNVELVGDVDIDNLAGLPGIRAAVPAQLAALAAPVLVKAHVASSCQLKAVTGGDINIAVQPAPDLGVQALGESNNGRVNITVDAAVAGETPGESPFRVRRFFTTAGYQGRRIKIEIRAASGTGNVNISSTPAAPLAPPRTGQ